MPFPSFWPFTSERGDKSGASRSRAQAMDLTRRFNDWTRRADKRFARDQRLIEEIRLRRTEYLDLIEAYLGIIRDWQVSSQNPGRLSSEIDCTGRDAPTDTARQIEDVVSRLEAARQALLTSGSDRPIDAQHPATDDDLASLLQSLKSSL